MRGKRAESHAVDNAVDTNTSILHTHNHLIEYWGADHRVGWFIGLDDAE